MWKSAPAKGAKVLLVFGASVVSETRPGHSKKICFGTGESILSEMDGKDGKEQCPRPAVVQRFNQKPYISTTTFQHDDAGSTWHWKSQRILVAAVNDQHSTTFRLFIPHSTPQKLQRSHFQSNWNGYDLDCTGAEGQTDDEKSVNFERHVREMRPGILSSARRWPSESITRHVPTRHPPGYESQHHLFGWSCCGTSRASDKFPPTVNGDLEEKISSLSLEDGVEKIVAALPLPSEPQKKSCNLFFSHIHIH
ncbi:hypothetical protein EDD15DRAFT_2196343 [Pisolithus albus]|nr:hypothetical protein EDD15DRAFT_2196343 [Pisolithus albus]